jgi:RNA polymerase sigma factor (sigma-70 family)
MELRCDEADSALVARARSGDAAAFSALIERHYMTIYRVAYKWCGERTTAEDIAQDVCVKLAAALRSFDGRAAFTSWLYRVTLNVVRDHQRGAKRRQARHQALAEITPTSAPADQEANTTIAQIWRLVDCLPHKQRDAVMLVFGEDMSHAQAAEVLGCKESTASWYVHRAKKTLKGLL